MGGLCNLVKGQLHFIIMIWLDVHVGSYQGLIDPRSGERACNSAYACRDGKVLVVTKNRTPPFSKACPTPLKNGPKPLAKLYNSPKNSRASSGQRRLHSCLCHPPTHLVLFLVTTSILPSLQAYVELHALSPLRGLISPWSYQPLVLSEEVRHTPSKCWFSVPFFCIASNTKKGTLSQQFLTHVAPPLGSYSLGSQVELCTAISMCALNFMTSEAPSKECCYIFNY